MNTYKIKMPRDMWTAIENIVTGTPQLGYEEPNDFILEAVRHRMLQLRELTK